MRGLLLLDRRGGSSLPELRLAVTQPFLWAFLIERSPGARDCCSEGESSHAPRPCVADGQTLLAAPPYPCRPVLGSSGASVSITVLIY